MAIEKKYGKNARAAFNANKNLQNSYRAAERMNDLNRTTMRPNMNIDDYMKNNSVSLENSRLIKPIIDISNIGVDNSIRPIGSMRETIKSIMDIDEYFKLERRDSFDFDKFKQDFADTPIRDIENMFVNGTGDFGDFYSRNLNTPLNEVSNAHSNAFDVASKYSTQRKEYEMPQPNYDMEVGDYISRVDSSKDNFSYNNIYDSTNDVDNYHGMYGNVSSEIGVKNKPYEYQGKIKDLSINGTQAQTSDIKIDDGYDYTNMIDDDVDNYHSMYGQVSDEIDVGNIGNGIVKGKYEDQINIIQNNYDSVRINEADLNKNGYQMQGVETSNFALNSDFSSENINLSNDVIENNITGYRSDNYTDNWKNKNKNSLFSDYLQTQSSDLYELNKDFGLYKLVNRIESGEELRQFEKDDIDFFKKELNGIYDRSVEKAKELGIDNIDDYDDIKKINTINSYLNGDRDKINEVNDYLNISKNNDIKESNVNSVVNDVNNATETSINNTTDNASEIIDNTETETNKINKLMNDEEYFKYNETDDFYKDIKIERDNETIPKPKGLQTEADQADLDILNSFENLNNTSNNNSTIPKPKGLQTEADQADLDILNSFEINEKNNNVSDIPKPKGLQTEADQADLDALDTFIKSQFQENNPYEDITDEDAKAFEEFYRQNIEENMQDYNFSKDQEEFENFEKERQAQEKTQQTQNKDDIDEVDKATKELEEKGANKLNIVKEVNGTKISAEIPLNNKNDNKFNYNEDIDNTVNAKDLASKIWGKDVSDDNVEQLVRGYAKSDKNIADQIKGKASERGFDFNKVNLKTSGDNAVSIGTVLADINQDNLEIFDKNGKINQKNVNKILDPIKDNYDLEKLNKGFTAQAYKNRFKNAYDKVQGRFLEMSTKTTGMAEEISDILDKVKEGTRLEADEAKAFHKYQVALKEYRDEIVEWAEGQGYDAESVFGVGGFKSSSKNKKKKGLKNFNSETEGSREWAFNRESINKINNQLGWLNKRVDLETGQLYDKKIEAKDTLKKDLESLKNNSEFSKAMENGTINKDNYLDYLSKNKEALSDDTAKKLYNLQQKDGVDIGDEGRQVLQGLAIAHEGKLDNKNGAVTKLNTALETLSSENYMNIKDDNIDRIGKGLVYKDNKYQLDMDKLNLTDEQKNSETFKKIIESDNVGTEDLKGIFDASTINNYIQGKNIDEKEFNKIIGEKVSGLEDSKYDTGLNIKEQLKKRGIEDNKIIDEIANAKNNGTDNLSAEAKVAIATLKDPLDQNEIDFGSINKDKMKEYINNNKGFFGDPKDIENMNEKELYGLFGKAFEGTVTDGKLAKGYDFKVKGKDVTTAEGFTDFYNSVLGKDGKDLDWDKVFSSLGATEEGKAQFKDAFEWMKGKKGQKEFKQMNIANSARDYLVKMFDEASGNENIDAKTKEQIKKHAEILKTKKMDDVASKVDVDSITKDIGKFDKIGKEAGKGIVDSIKGGGKWKTIGGAALTLGGLGALGMFASNAAEERERKRQEMQQLMMAQNQSIRGGY